MKHAAAEYNDILRLKEPIKYRFLTIVNLVFVTSCLGAYEL